MNQRIVGGLVAASLLLGTAVGSLAAESRRTVQAVEDAELSIVFGGEKQVLKDGAGTVIYPLLLEGSAYVPVRALAGIFGVPVEWEAQTKTVYLGGRERQPYDLAASMGSGNDYCWKIRDAQALVYQGQGGDSTYPSGLIRDIWNGTASSSSYTLLPLDVPAGATKLRFSASSDIAANILVLDEKGGMIASFACLAGGLIEKEIDISGYERIAFGANAVQGRERGQARIFAPQAY